MVLDLGRIPTFKGEVRQYLAYQSLQSVSLVLCHFSVCLSCLTCSYQPVPLAGVCASVVCCGSDGATYPTPCDLPWGVTCVKTTSVRLHGAGGGDSSPRVSGRALRRAPRRAQRRACKTPLRPRSTGEASLGWDSSVTSGYCRRARGRAHGRSCPGLRGASFPPP